MGTTALSIGLEKPNRFRTEGGLNEHLGRNEIGTGERAEIENIATAFACKGSTPETVYGADIDKIQSRIGSF